MLANVNRPIRFSDVVGQNAIVQNIREQSRQDKFFSTYVFAGQFGAGKTSIARILAMATNCKDKKDGEPCGVCEWCRNFSKSPDYNEIDGASNNGVDKVRELIDSVSYAPMAGKYKVYIIDEVHMLSVGAFNALLKTLEEPPAHVIFILATTEIKKIPATVLSRAAVYNFRQIPAEDIAARLLKSGINVTEDAAKLIAGQSGGSMRNAWGILEQAAAGSSEVTADTVRELLMLNSGETVFGLLLAVKSCDIRSIAGQMQSYISGGNLLGSLLDDMEDALRVSLLALAGINPDADEEYNTLVGNYISDMSASDLCTLSDGVMRLIKDYRAGMTDEGVIVRVISLAQRYGNDNSQLIERVRKLEEQIINLGRNVPDNVAADETEEFSAPEDTEASEAEAPEETISSIKENVEDVKVPVMAADEASGSEFDLLGDFDFMFDVPDVSRMQIQQENNTQDDVEKEEEEADSSDGCDVAASETALEEAMRQDDIFRAAVSNADRHIENGKVIISTPFKEIKRIINKCIEVYALKGIKTLE